MKSPPVTTSRFGPQLVTFVIVAASSVLFCSKGVVVKLAYAHGADTLSVLALRMGFALPFFIGIALWGSRGAMPLTLADWGKLAGLGFVGYYLSSFVNFAGLQFVSVGLERILLYTYPSIVLLIAAFGFRQAVRPSTWLFCLVAWMGIVIAFIGESHRPAASSHVAWGSLLILTSALTYAVYVSLSGNVIRRIGVMRFTGIVLGFSCVFVLIHASLVIPIERLMTLPAAVYREGVILALLGTVAPALLGSIGLRRTSAQQFAIIGTVGPITTLFLAWAVLGETLHPMQIVGFALAVGGGLAVSLRKEKN